MTFKSTLHLPDPKRQQPAQELPRPTPTEIAAGNGTVRKGWAVADVVAAINAWVPSVPGVIINPMNTWGDIIFGGQTPAGVPTRLGAGASGTFLKSNGVGADPAWAAVAGAVPCGWLVSRDRTVGVGYSCTGQLTGYWTGLGTGTFGNQFPGRYLTVAGATGVRYLNTSGEGPTYFSGSTPKINTNWMYFELIWTLSNAVPATGYAWFGLGATSTTAWAESINQFNIVVAPLVFLDGNARLYSRGSGAAAPVDLGFAPVANTLYRTKLWFRRVSATDIETKTDTVDHLTGAVVSPETAVVTIAPSSGMYLAFGNNGAALVDVGLAVSGGSGLWEVRP